MERTSETASRKFSIKVESQELDRIIQARKNLDDVKLLAVYAAQYKNLGWSPVALEVVQGTDLGVNFEQPEAGWVWSLMDFALQDIRVGLTIHLKPNSPLFVIRVKPALGNTLGRLGDWRSPCVARLGDIWEHHFLMLPKTWRLSPDHIIGDEEAPLSIIGPGHAVTVPPSVDPASQVAWHWLAPPWEQPPGQPSPELLILLEDCGFIVREALTAVEDLPSWKEIYPLICHSERLIQALLAPEESSAIYCRNILQEALQAGFRDLTLLLSLLWHAPHSELRHDPDGRDQLCQWAEKLQELLGAETSDLAGGAAVDREEAAAPSSSEDLMEELQLLAAQTLELEEQLEKLESLRSLMEAGAEGSPPPSPDEQGPSQDLAPKENQREMKDLRQVMEEFLAGIKNLSEPE